MSYFKPMVSRPDDHARKSFAARLMERVQGLVTFHEEHDQSTHAGCGPGGCVHARPSGILVVNFNENDEAHRKNPLGYKDIGQMLTETRKVNRWTPDGFVKDDENMLGVIENGLDGLAVVRHGAEDQFLDPNLAVKGRMHHPKYRIHQIGLENELLANNGQGIRTIVKNEKPIEIIRSGETGSHTSAKSPEVKTGPRTSELYVYNTKDRLGVGLKVVVDKDSKKVSTVMPYSEELEEMYRDISASGDAAKASRVTRAAAREQVDAHRLERGRTLTTATARIENGEIVYDYDYRDEL